MEDQRHKGISFAKRMYAPRCVGLAVGFVSVLPALHDLQVWPWLWLPLLLNGFAWPHVAYQLARRSARPFQAEHRNLLCDSFLIAGWAAAIGFNPLPSIVIVSMAAMNTIAAGGLRLFLQGGVASLLGAATVYLLASPALVLQTTPLQVYACLPMIFIYPLAVGMVCYRLAVKLTEHKLALSKLSQTDSLTGLLNHGSWMALMQTQFIKCKALSHPTTIALIDIDHFKTINDTYGHLVGDDMLRQLSTDMIKTLHTIGIVGRIGGDEFCVIFPGITPEQAGQRLRLLLATIHAYRHARIPGLAMSLSIGVATFDAQLLDAGAWLDKADKALYSAKRNGRNRINYAP
jgi:diguanylate cyclase